MKLIISYISRVVKGTSFINFFHLGLSQAINVLVALMATPYLYQRLGEAEFGRVNLALSIVLLLSVLVNYGFNLNAPKRIALIKKDSSELSSLISDVLIFRAIIGLALVGLILILIKWFSLFENNGLIVSLSLVILLSEAFFPQFILQGLEKLKWLSIANMLSKIVYLCALYIFISSATDSIYVNFLFGCSALLINIVLLIVIFRHLNLTLRPLRLVGVSHYLRTNFNFFLSTIAGQVSIYGGLIILTNFVSDTELGKYSLAQRVAFLMRLVPVFLAQAILQNASRLFFEDRERFDIYLRKVTFLGLFLTGVLSFTVFFTSKWIVFLVGGEYVQQAEYLLKVLAFVPFLGMFNIPNMIKILVSEQQLVLAKATWLVAIFMLALSFLGSMWFGSEGMAYALLLTELFNFIVHSILLRRSNRQLSILK